MRCFSATGSHRRTRHKKGLAEQAAPISGNGAKMTRTFSAPPSFLGANGGPASPLNNPQHRALKKDQHHHHQQQQQDVSSPGATSALITQSGTLPSGYNSLGGLKREAVFRGQPLPLPTPESCGLEPTVFIPSSSSPSDALSLGAFSFPSPSPSLPSRSNSSTAPVLKKSASMPLPRPPPPPPPASTVCESARINFSPGNSCIGESGNGPAFRCSVCTENSSSNNGVQRKEREAVLIRLVDITMQDSKAWMEDVKATAALRHAHLSKILGFSFTNDERLVVYEGQHGSLDKLLYGRGRDNPPLDWSTRIRIASHAAKGLAYLHEKSSNKLMYKDFRTFNIHVDKDFRGKLVGYGFTRRSLDADSLMVAAYAAPELISGGPISTKSNVWSFGVVLLEILTGRQNRDEIFPQDEQDLVHWTAEYLNDDKRLFLIVDPELKGRFPAKSVAMVGSLASQCLRMDAALRPSMDEAIQILEAAQELDRINTLGNGNDVRKPLIEALKECGSPWASPSPSLAPAIHPALSAPGQKRLVARLVRTLCSSA